MQSLDVEDVYAIRELNCKCCNTFLCPEGEQEQEARDYFKMLEKVQQSCKRYEKDKPAAAFFFHHVFDISLLCLCGLLQAVRRVQLEVRMQIEGMMNISGYK